MNEVLMNLVPLSKTSSNWELGTFLQNATSTLQKWGGYFIILVGVVMILFAVYQIASGFISHGKKQTNWFIAVALLLVGGAFSVGGYSFVANIAAGGKETIENLGKGDGTTNGIPQMILYSLKYHFIK